MNECNVDFKWSDTWKYDTYRDWNLYRIPWGDGVLKLAATRYEFLDTRSPVVHKDCMLINGVLDPSQEDAECTIKKRIDAIENEGFDVFMAREFPESVK